MKISLAITFGSLALAILMAVVVESRISRRLAKRTASVCAWTAFLGCYGVCVGVVSLLIGYFFHLSEWLALAIAVPLGFPVFIFAGRLGEA